MHSASKFKSVAEVEISHNWLTVVSFLVLWAKGPMDFVSAVHHWLSDLRNHWRSVFFFQILHRHFL